MGSVTDCDTCMACMRLNTGCTRQLFILFCVGQEIGHLNTSHVLPASCKVGAGGWKSSLSVFTFPKEQRRGVNENFLSKTQSFVFNATLLMREKLNMYVCMYVAFVVFS